MSPSARARRTLRWSALAALVLSVLWAGYRFTEKLAEAAPQIAANRLLLTALTLILVVLALGFVGVLIRNLVRLILERKRGLLGAKLRTKLVFFFLALVLLPALLLSYGAAAFLKSTVDALLETPIEDVVREARALVKETGRRDEATGLRLARRLADDLTRPVAGIDAPDNPEAIRGRLEVAARREGLHVAYVQYADGRPAVLAVGRDVPAARRDELKKAASRVASDVLGTGNAAFRLEPVSDGFLSAGAAPWSSSGGVPRGARDAAVVAGLLIGSADAARMDRIAAGQGAFEQFRSERRELLRLYYSLIALIGLATVFVATWIGFTLSRRITVPIQEVAAATREIAGGNLGVRVRAAAGDEVGMLVDAFNEMAAQLQESREVITRSTADLRRANQALEERRRYVETLVANLSSGVLSFDQDGRITTANPAAGTILGLALRPGDDVRERLSAPGLAPLRAILGEDLRSDGATGRRDLSLRRAGASVSVSAQIEPLRGGRGEDLGTLVVVEDVTELLRAQKALAWHEVARRIAHEIKNPLTPIRLSAQRLRKKAAEGADDLGAVIDGATASIEQEVGVLNRLVDEFSRYARMPEPVPEPVAFGEIIASVLSLYGGHPSVRWEADVDPDVGTVSVDREQMRRVLVNLIDNAIAATGGAGRIRVSARPWQGSGSVRLEVEDDGPGIPAAHRDRLFEPYFSTKRRGTGLGLAIVHRIVAEHRGTIRVEDPPAGGVRFVIEIPGEARAVPAPARQER